MGCCDPDYEALDPKDQSKHYRKVIIGIIIIAVVVLVVVSVGVGVGVHQITKNNCSPSENLPDGVVGLNLSDVNTHLLALQAIASLNDNTRALGTDGYAKSMDYVISQLSAYPKYFSVATQQFVVPNWTVVGTPAFSEVSPDVNQFLYGVEFVPISYSGNATNLEGNLMSVTGDGCNPSDFNGDYTGKIAIIMRGNCTISQKVVNAVTLGAIGVVLINLPNFFMVGNAQPAKTVPVILVTNDIGITLLNQMNSDTVTVSITVQGAIINITTWNVIADTYSGNQDNTIVIGSHLDSVPAGPGINDNGSGTSINLAIALQMARDGVNLNNRIRFAWWGAEEQGLLGSTFYVNNLISTNKTALNQIVANVNLDMIASPNYLVGIYNGTGAASGIVNGSTYIQVQFQKAFNALSVNHTNVPFDGRSDYQAFINNGIPAGGVFAGAEQVKDIAGRATFGGIANAPYDPCYHQACDTFANINQVVLDQMGDTSATVAYNLGGLVNIRNVFNLPAFATATRSSRIGSASMQYQNIKGYLTHFKMI